MKHIIISERQYKKVLLKEAALDSFSLETLDKIKSFRGRVKYCQEQLGRPQGRGSSRIIFQIDDDKILKLALNEKGLAQNELEGQDDYYKSNLEIFPKVFQHSENFTWIISEFVLPAKSKDFIECFGISEEKFFDFIETLAAWHRPKGIKKLSKEEMTKLLENEWLQAYEDYIACYTDTSISDMVARRNYGMALRNGEPIIVLLDSGLDDYIYRQYYMRW